ncbi:MAG: sporulation protein YabP [bacterium]
MENRIEVGQHHRLLLLDREVMELEGVRRVESFNENQIVLETNKGYLKILGEDMHIQNLDLDTEKLHLVGLITAVEYIENKQGLKGKKILNRLFR